LWVSLEDKKKIMGFKIIKKFKTLKNRMISFYSILNTIPSLTVQYAIYFHINIAL
jgi:hypothetical protein